MTRTAFLSAWIAAGSAAVLAALLPSPALPPRGKDAPPRAAVLPPTDRRPLEAYAAIWQKPLFNRDRQGMEKPPSSLAREEGLRPLSDYRLVGVVIAKDVKFALVERSDSKQVVTLHLGDDLDGRRVDDIRIGGIVLNGSEFLPMPHPPGRLKRARL